MRADSDSTPQTGGPDSIFRLLPRESRNAIRRMMHIEPSARCTLTDLLKGRGKSSGLLCGCTSASCVSSSSSQTINGATVLNCSPGHLCTDHCDPEDEDDGDEWLKGIVACSREDVKPDHTHVKVVVEENKTKKRFF